MVTTSETEFKRSAIPSQARDTIFLTWGTSTPKSRRPRPPSLMPEMFSKRLRTLSENSSSSLIKLTATVKSAVKEESPLQPFISTRCSWLRRKLFTWPWTSWSGKTRALSVISGPHLSKKTSLRVLLISTQQPRFPLTMITISRDLHTSRRLTSWTASNRSLTRMVFLLIRKPILLLSLLWLSRSFSEWCLVIWVMDPSIFLEGLFWLCSIINWKEELWRVCWSTDTSC